MLTDDDRILLTEFLGECWHVQGDPQTPICYKCMSYFIELAGNRTFTTWRDTGDLKKRIVKMGEWYQFAKFAKRSWDAEQVGKKFVYDDLYFSAVLMNPIRFPELVVGWLKERGNYA